MNQTVLVIGGGVIGAMTALYLVRAGARVTIIDQDRFGNACSHGNCGYVCPSHVLPLTQPGIVRQNLFKAFRKSSPLYVKPRLSLSLLRWMFNFSRRCNQSDMMSAASSLHALLRLSRQEYDSLIRSDRPDCDWSEDGLLFVYRDKHAIDHYATTASMLSDQFGVANRRIDEDELLALEPAIKPGAASGAYHFPGDAHLRPDRLMSALKSLLIAGGVSVVEQCKAISLSHGTLTTSKGDYRADQFVVATGAWTPGLNALIGATIPIQPGKGYSLTMPRPAVCPKHPIIFEQDHVAITPWASGYRIGSTMEFSGYDTTLNPARLDNLRRAASLYLQQPDAEPILEQWYGWRPMTWDSLPVIGRSPARPDVVVAAGHNMLGLSLATGTARLVTELIAGQKPSIPLSPYSLSRLC
jgi:D-amino-acid dehydrogenase